MHSHTKEVRHLIQKAASQLSYNSLSTLQINSLNFDCHPSAEGIDFLADLGYLEGRVTEVFDLLVDCDL